MNAPLTLEKHLEASLEHYRFVYRLSFRLLRNEADAEDLTQTVFLSLLKARKWAPQFLATLQSPRAFLAQATLNKAASWRRAETRRRRREESWAKRVLQTLRGAAMPQNEQHSEAIENAIQALPEKLRIPIVLHYREGLNYREIAAACDCPASTVASRLTLARARLRKKLEQAGALSAALVLEEVLRAEPPISIPEGLESRLEHSLEHVRQNLAASNGAPVSGNAAGWGGQATRAGLLKGGASLLLAVLFSGGGWMILERAGRSGLDVPSAPAASGVAAARRQPDRRRDLRRPGRPRSGAALDAADGAGAAADASGGDAAPAPGAGGEDALVFGWVRDRRGRPLEGAQVDLYDGGSETPAASTATDADGYYQLRPAAAAVEKVEWMNAVARSAAPGAPPAAACSSCHPEMPAGEDPAGAPPERCAGAAKRLALDVAARADKELALTFSLTAAQEQFTLLAPAEAKLRTWVVGTGGDQAQQVKSLVYQKVVEAEYSRFLSGVQLTQTLDAGAREFHVAARAPGYQVARSGSLHPGEKEPARADLTLDAAPILSGGVFTETGEAIEGATVSIAAHLGSALLPRNVASVTTGPDGQYEFPSLPRGNYILAASAPGFIPRERIHGSGESQAIFQLSMAAGLKARVIRRGTGENLEGFLVEAWQDGRLADRKTTGEGGEASFDLLPGVYILDAYRPNSTSKISRASARVIASRGETAEVVMEVDRMVDIGGEVVFPEGGPPPQGFQIQARSLVETGGRSAGAALAEIAGARFQFDNLPPGRYSLELQRRESNGSIAVYDRVETDLQVGRIAAPLILSAASAAAVQEPAAPPARARDRKRADWRPYFSGDAVLAIEDESSLRILLQLLSLGGSASFSLAPELSASSAPDEIRIQGRSLLSMADLFETLRKHGLDWDAGPGGLRIHD